MFWQVRVSQAELSPSEEGDVLLADPPSPGGLVGPSTGLAVGGKASSTSTVLQVGGGVAQLFQGLGSISF